MNHGDFIIGRTFWCDGRIWRCTDIGTRTIIAIRIDSVVVASNVPDLRRTLSRSEAEAEDWFNGPPYAVLERVFDENGIKACSPDPDNAALAGSTIKQTNPLALDRPARPLLPALSTGMNLLHLLKVLATRWMHLESPEFALLTYLYRRAADTEDGMVRQPRKEIAAATRILPRKIRRLLKSLHDCGAIEVISPAEEQVVWN